MTAPVLAPHQLVEFATLLADASGAGTTSEQVQIVGGHSTVVTYRYGERTVSFGIPHTWNADQIETQCIGAIELLLRPLEMPLEIIPQEEEE